MQLNRRSFLTLTASLVPAATLRALAQSDQTPVRRLLQMNAYALDVETPLDLLTDYLTPNELFFIRHHWRPIPIDPNAWILAIEGDVSQPLRLTLEDLRTMPRTTATCVLQCAGNGRALFNPPIPGVQWRYGAVGNARWTGVRVKDLLDRAGLKATAKHLHTFGRDVPPGRVPRFDRSLEIEKALADGIVAYEMNDQPLSHDHGGPARLVVPGWAGDHWMKWLVRLAPAPAPQTGFYMDTGYRYPMQPGPPGVAFPPDQMRPVTEVFVKSNITQAPERTRTGAAVTIRGFAFSGAPDIAKVEISVDDGTSWTAAELDPRHDPYAWRLWSFRWTPRATGKLTILARATDSRGAVQPRAAVWNQSGYLFNGWHGVPIEVTA